MRRQPARVLSAALWLSALGLSPAAARLPLPPPAGSPTPAVALRLERADAELRRTAAGRRLLAETLDVPRLQGVAADGVAFQRGSPGVLILDSSRLKSMNEDELELSLARALAQAAMALPFALPEEDMAAYQAELDFALERAERDGDFSGRLRAAYREASRVDAAAPSRSKRFPAPREPLPRGELARAGRLLLLFARDPDEFYHAVEADASRDPGSVRLSELEDFVERYGPDYSGARLGPSGLYAWLGSRRYPPGLLRAARRLAQGGGLASLREALGPFQTVGRDELKLKLNAWLRKGT
ncbi:MAG: hypothetical protein PHF00_09095 [Elusimicrobia bacterium]|nr:hypothetical protein [Elusimicrobiota bacterium]